MTEQFDEWYEHEKERVYDNQFNYNTALVNTVLYNTNHFNEIDVVNDDLLKVLRYTFKVPISNDRMRYKGTSKEAIQKIIAQRKLLDTQCTSIIIDRITLSEVDKIMRKAQEKRQCSTLKTYLSSNSFNETTTTKDYKSVNRLNRGCYTENYMIKGNGHFIKIDMAVKCNECLYFIEMKSATDYSNTSKRAKEEEARINRISQIMSAHPKVKYKTVLLLSGYFTKEFIKKFEGIGVKCVTLQNIEALNIGSQK